MKTTYGWNNDWNDELRAFQSLAATGTTMVTSMASYQLGCGGVARQVGPPLGAEA